jgi:hypothetical protein
MMQQRLTNRRFVAPEYGTRVATRWDGRGTRWGGNAPEPEPCHLDNGNQGREIASTFSGLGRVNPGRDALGDPLLGNEPELTTRLVSSRPCVCSTERSPHVPLLDHPTICATCPLKGFPVVYGCSCVIPACCSSRHVSTLQPLLRLRIRREHHPASEEVGFQPPRKFRLRIEATGGIEVNRVRRTSEFADYVRNQRIEKMFVKQPWVVLLPERFHVFDLNDNRPHPDR